jgi:hypothetical protein
VAISDSVHQAILEPGASDTALLTLGTKAGTLTGEAVRTLMQYKSYPLAMLRRVNRRFGAAYANTNQSFMGMNLKHGTVEKIVWAGSMLATAYTALVIKDLLKGREPLNPFDTDQYSVENASRVISQAGIGPFAVAENFLSPRAALGPFGGGVWNIADQALTGTGYSRVNSLLGMLPGASSPLKQMEQAVLGWVFVDTYGMQHQRAMAFQQHKTGQSNIFQHKLQGTPEERAQNRLDSANAPQ